MSLLIFGQSGQVAQDLAAQVPDAICLGRDAGLTRRESFAEAIKAHSPDAVINAAAYTAVDMAEQDIDAARFLNCDAPGAMAQVCAALEIPFVHISTDYVFSGTGERPWQPEDPVDAQGVYGQTKAEGEAAVRAAGGAHAILRTSWVFSAHGGNFLKTMLNLGDRLSALDVISDQVGGPTPAAAIATACLKIAKDIGLNADKSGTYHFSGAPDASWYDFACEIFKASGQAVTVNRVETATYEAAFKDKNPTAPRAARPLNSRLDCATLEAVFGIARPDWRAATARIVKELRDDKA